MLNKISQFQNIKTDGQPGLPTSVFSCTFDIVSLGNGTTRTPPCLISMAKLRRLWGMVKRNLLFLQPNV